MTPTDARRPDTPTDDEAKLRAFGRWDPRIDLAGRVVPRFLAERRAAPEGDLVPHRPLRLWLLGTSVLVAGGLALVSMPQPERALGDPSSAPPLAERDTGLSASTESAGAIVVGPEPMRALGPGPTRTFAPGDAVPLGVRLAPKPQRGASVAVAGRAEVRLDPGTEIDVEAASADSHALALYTGRIALEVRRTSRPLRVRIPSAGVELSTDAASMGVLAPGGGRWAAAITSGEAHVSSSAAPRRPTAEAGPVLPESPTRIGLGMLAGGAPQRPIVIRPIPDDVLLEVVVETAADGSIVRGLSDLLARVEMDGAEVDLDGGGRFRIAVEAAQTHLRLAAVDAAGHRVTRVLTVDARAKDAPKPRSSADPRRRTAPPSGSKRAKTPMRVTPPNW